MARRSVEEAKQQEQERARRRAEWDATPDALKVCVVCGLKLSAVDIARITEKPVGPRYHEGICSPFDSEITSDVARGLVSMLREVYGNDGVPLSEFKKLGEVWRSQRGRCYLSQIRLSFPVEETPLKPTPCPPSVSILDHARMERERQKEQAERMRAAELHAPSIDFDSEGKLRLVSKTVAKWREGLTDQEFVSLIQTLHRRLPDLQKYQGLNIATSATATVPRRDRNRY
jgi:hypothetical protein